MKRKNQIAPEFLTDTSIAENAYLLGRLWADGNVGRWHISLYGKVGDLEHIFDFINRMGIFTIYQRQRMVNGENFGKPSWSIQISCVVLNKFLTEHDFKEKSRKSPSKILSKIPIENHHLFWLGFFDGDGCLYVDKKRRVRRLNFWGTIEQDWTDLLKIIDRFNLSYEVNKYIRKNGKHQSSTVEIRRATDVKTFCDWLYQSYDKNKIGMPRKYEKYLELKENFKTLTLGTKNGAVGVYALKGTSKWMSIISPTRKNGLKKHLHLGRFDTREEALKVRENKMKELGFEQSSEKREVHFKTFISKPS